MKAVRTIVPLLLVCVLLTLVTLLAPAMHSAALSYLSFSFASLVGIVCILALAYTILHRENP
ncbi:MAG: hypothetical protein II904_02000 [Oscillospiraceae bacterium]|nr:hypothetical protein [Oscillospiraceae bacterium]